MVAFLFTDVEGSTHLWERHPADMAVAIKRHDEIVRSAIEQHGGYVFSTAGDAFAAAFSLVSDALDAAMRAQAQLAQVDWPGAAVVRVRMGIHVGGAAERDGDYFGPTLNRTARLMSAGHGGQVLLSSVSAQLVPTADLIDLGEHQLKDLDASEHVWQVGRREFPPLNTLDRVAHNLPTPRTPLIGRDEDIAAVIALLDGKRLVSLLGIGGSGKTRLAQAVAASSVDRYPDGVWFVDLVPATNDREIALAVASNGRFDLGVGDPVEAVIDLLSSRRSLFVLDNCEHVTDSVAELVDAVLERSDTPTFLVTSRESLNLPDEHRYHVDPLDTSGVQSPAVELFLATAERAGSPIDETAVEIVAEICRHLDGLPLAVELAAGQLHHLRPDDILRRLDQRFTLLAGGRGRGRKRQGSLQAVLQDTWQMLDHAEQELLQHLAAFPSSFDLEGAERVAGRQTAQTLAGLVDRSLVTADANVARYRLLETIKLFARERWTERADPEECPRRHAQALMEKIDSWSEDDVYSLLDIAAWHAAHLHDLRAADDHLFKRGDVALALRLWTAGAILWHLGQSTTSAEVIERIDRCLAAADLPPLLVAKAELAAACAAMAARQQDRLAASAARAAKLAEATGAPVVHAFALNAMSWMTMVSDVETALTQLRQSGEIAAAAAARNVELAALTYQACALALHQRDGARELIDRVEAENEGQRTYAAHSLAQIRLMNGLFDEPERTAYDYPYRQAELALGTTFQNANLLAIAKAAIGDPAGTADALLGAEAETRRMRDDGLPDLLIAPAMLAYSLGEHALASRWITAVRLARTPTHNLPTTAIYRQLRQRVGLTPTTPELTDLDAVYHEARAWVHDRSRAGQTAG